MANLLSNTTIGGYQSIHTGNVGSYAMSSSGGTLSGTLTIGTAGSTSQTRALRIVPTGSNPNSFGSYSGSWRSAIEIWDNQANTMLFLAPPDGTNYNYSIIKSVGAGLAIDVGSAGGTNAIAISAAGVVNAPQGLQVGGNSVVSTAGGQTIAGTTYFSGGESLNVYGIRGRFTNEYIHLYNKVGIGHPGGWGQGEGNTPNFGLSTYGGINIAYGSDNGATINTYTRINKNWGGGDYGAESFTIRGTYPSITLRSTNANFKWLLHTDASGNFRWYTGSEADNNAWTNRFTFGIDNNFYVDYGHVYVSGGNSTQWNTAYSWGNHASAGYQPAATAITTSNIGSQSVSYASTAGSLSSMNISQFTNNSGYFASGSYSWTSPVFGQYGIKSNLIDNVLYSAADRFEVFKDGVAWNTNCLFNLNYDQNCDVISSNTSRTYSIILNTKGNPSYGIVYTEGNIYLSFYYVFIPGSVSGRVRFQNGNWVAMSGWTNVANNGSYAVWRGNVPGGNYMVEIEITINANSSNNTWFAQWEYVMGRPGQYELGIFNKAQDNSVWRSLYFLDSSNVARVTINSGGISANTVTSNNFNVSNAIYFGGGNNYLNWTNSRIYSNVGIESADSLRAPIFYDSQDSNYYADFNSTVNNAIRVRGGMLMGPNPTWGAYLQVGGDGNNSSYATMSVTNGNIHIDPKNGYNLYLNHYYGSKIYFGSGGSAGGSNHHSNFSGGGNLNLGGGESDASYRLQVSGTGYASSDFRAPIFYDSNDTNYYGDFAGTSRLNNLYLEGGVASVYNASGYSSAAIEVRERNFGGAQDDTWATAPRIGFHWGGRVASQIALASNGRIHILNDPGTANEAFQAGIIYSSGYGDSTQWKAAYDWGNHASAGYISTSYLDDYTRGSYRVISDYGGNTTWYLRGNGQFIWGLSHDWSYSFRLNLPSGSQNNSTWAYFGQQDSNAGSGTWRGVRIRKYASGSVDGDLSAGALYIGDTRKDQNWDSAYSWGNHASAGYITSSALSSYVPLSGATLTEGNYFYFRSNRGSYLGALDSPSLQVYASGGNAAFMSFHRGGNYAVNFGLDSDNVMRIGGWSAAADRWVLDMSGNNTVAGSFRAPIFYDSANTNFYGDFASTSVMNSIRFGTSTNNATLSGASTWGVTLTTDAGWIQFGPANGSWAHIYASQSFYFNQDLYVNGNVVITSATIGSQSVSYASTAGSADQIDGRGFVNTGSNNATYADSINSNGISYVAFNISLLGQTDGALYSQAYDSAWQHQIYGDYRTGQIVVRGKLNGTWQAWRTVIDSSTIGSQSVSYASTAGSLTSMNISQFTNNSGYLTGITSGQVTGALGYTPYNSSNPSGYITSSGSISGNAATATYATTAGSAPNGGNINQFYNVSAGVGNGLSFWNGSSAYKISMGVGSLYQYGPVSDYSIKMQMNDGDTGRGFTWGRESYAPIAALNSTSGDMEVAGYYKSYGYRGNGNVGGTGTASWHPDGIYCGSTMWQYGTMYKNNTGIYDVSEFKLNAGPVLGTYNTRNLIVKAHDSNDVMGILGQKSGGGFAFQIYGDGSNYGFLNGAWAGWDIKKTNNGAMYMNNNDSYYLQTNSTSNFYALNIQGSAVVHAGNIGSQSVSYASSAGSVAWTNVSSRPTALSQFSNDLGNYGGWLTTGGKAADSELFDGTDSIYFVKGNGTNALGRTTTNLNGTNSAQGLSSGFYDGTGMSNMPTSDWYHLIVNSHYNSATTNQYEFQLATAFWDKSNFYVRSISPGDVGPWRTLIHNGNIGSQSVNYANSAGSASSATTATTATVASQLNKFGDIYGQDWNSYYIQDKFIASAVYGHSGANRPNLTYDYGVMLSYGETSGPLMQMYFPENSPNLGTIFRKATYRTGWNGNWSTWKTLVEQEGNTCTIVGGNQTGMEIHANVGYNQDPLTYFLLRGQADTSWKALKIRLTGDAGGQDIEFRRIAENGADARMFYVPRGANQVIFEYQFVQGSDSRLKDNIIPITNSLDKVKSLRGVEFDWNSGVNEGTHDVGLIAQEVEAVLPEAVTTQEDGYKNLAYTKVIPLLVEAMKEQQVMIDALKAEIELLKNK